LRSTIESEQFLTREEQFSYIFDPNTLHAAQAQPSKLWILSSTCTSI